MNLKSILSVVLWMSLVSNAVGLEGDSLIDSILQTQKKVSAEVPLGSILAWQATLNSDKQTTTKVLTRSGLLFEYQCENRKHGLSCRENSFSESGSAIKTSQKHSFITNGSKAALNNFIRTLKIKKISTKGPKIFKSITAWPEEAESHGGHSHGTNVWTKIEYETKNQTKEVFLLCHVHGSETKFSCHLHKSGSAEPSFQ